MLGSKLCECVCLYAHYIVHAHVTKGYRVQSAIGELATKLMHLSSSIYIYINEFQLCE